MILISGASGFIGSHLVKRLKDAGEPIRELHRVGQPGPDVAVANLSDRCRLLEACKGIDTVFHCAGHAHAFYSLAGQESALQWRVNFEGTRNLADAAGEAGVRYFVFLSSVKAMAEPGSAYVDESFPGEPLSEYGRAKRAAEAVVLATGRRYGMQVVNLRLCMVYGAGGRGNLERMARLVKQGWFPPLPETQNRRSMVHVNDVVSAMCAVAHDPRAAGQTFIVAGPETPSGRQLFNALRQAAGLPALGWAIPKGFLGLAARFGDLSGMLFRRRMLFDSEVLDRLLGTACYSPERLARLLGWKATVGLAEGLPEIFEAMSR